MCTYPSYECMNVPKIYRQHFRTLLFPPFFVFVTFFHLPQQTPLSIPDSMSLSQKLTNVDNRVVSAVGRGLGEVGKVTGG